MSRKYSCIAVLLLLFSAGSIAQTESLPLKIKLEQPVNGDSLWLTVTINGYKKPSSLMFTASLKTTHLTDTFFIPVIDSTSLFCFVFPSRINDDLLLNAYFSPGIFSISGQVNDHKKESTIKAILLTDNKKFFNKELVLDQANMFHLPPMVFENKASLVFNYANSPKSKDHPDVTIDGYPFSLNFSDLIFTEEVKRVTEPVNLTQSNATAVNGTTKLVIADTGKYKVLSDVTVTGIKKTNIQKFDETYSSALFNDAGEKIIDCLDNESILSYPDCMMYLQTRVAGLSVNNGHYGDMLVKWHGHEMKVFYIDEIQVDLEQLLGVTPADIAMIKVYPPPFFGANGNGDGGAIAVYTRHGEYRRADTNTNKWLFTVKGYASAVHVLFEKK